MSEPVIAAPLKKMLLGDKPWFKSVTTWGIIVFVGAQAMLSQACSDGVLGSSFCTTAGTVMEYVGGAMTVLGLRRAAVAPNVK